MPGGRDPKPREPWDQRGQRVPDDSRLFGRWIPVALLVMAGLTLILIGLALGVLLGLVPIR